MKVVIITSFNRGAVLGAIRNGHVFEYRQKPNSTCAHERDFKLIEHCLVERHFDRQTSRRAVIDVGPS